MQIARGVRSRCYRMYALLTWQVILNQTLRDSVLIYGLGRKEKIFIRFVHPATGYGATCSAPRDSSP